jgi:hypothetical protein
MSKKKNQNEPIPLKLVRKMSNIIPNCWNLCDMIAEDNGKNNLPKWGEKCLLPIAAAKAIVKSINLGNQLAGLYAWRRYKEIYSFDAELQDLLYEQANEEMIIPVDILLNLPYSAIWIDTIDYGLLVWIEYDIERGEYELRIDEYKGEEREQPLILHLDKGSTIEEGLRATEKQANQYIQNYLNINSDIIPLNIREALHLNQRKKIAKYLQLILYICADSTDVEENPNQKEITRKPSDSRYIKDAFREIRKWDVGYRVGNVIRHHKENVTNNQTKTSGTSGNGGLGVSKRPHSRRGHWHHYWIGSNADNSRKLILKWVAPTFINGDDNDTIATVHNVK